MQLAMNNNFKAFFGAELDRILAQRGLTPGKPVYILANISEDVVVAGTASLSDAITPGNNSPPRSLHNHDFPCSGEPDCVATRLLAIYQQFKTLSYPHYCITVDDVPKTLDGWLTCGFYA